MANVKMPRQLMILAIISLASTSMTSAAPQRLQADDVELLRYENVNQGADGYRFAYELSDGTNRQERGELENGVLVVRGSYSWTAPDGHTYTVDFVADENGFHPRISSGGGARGGDAHSQLVEYIQPEMSPQVVGLPPGALLSLVGG